MNHLFDIEPHVYDVVAELQKAGYETYVVGGAIRDLLQNRTPKDYDISTAATPEQIQKVFGRRRARIIGKRFQLVHVAAGRDLLEVSTFRRAPEQSGAVPETARGKKHEALAEAEHLIFADNDFGTSRQDAERRDFTVNALFYDPLAEELLDFTGHGVADIQAGLVRAIGNPQLRFEEDPVRMLRALKLVGQYGFQLERKTENDLRSSMHLLELASRSRLSLELEKIMQSAYAGSILQAFDDYGFLEYFLPWIGRHRDKELRQRALDLLKTRDRRVRAGFYRPSASVALAALALPFTDNLADGGARLRGELQPKSNREWNGELLRQIFMTVYAPLTVIRRLSIAACRVLQTQPLFHYDVRPERLLRQRCFDHAMELVKIQHESGYLVRSDAFLAKWRELIAAAGGVNGRSGSSEPGTALPRSARRRSRRRRKPSAPEIPDNAAEQEALVRDQLSAAAEDLA